MPALNPARRRSRGEIMRTLSARSETKVARIIRSCCKRRIKKFSDKTVDLGSGISSLTKILKSLNLRRIGTSAASC